MDEVWKPIIDYENIYEISNLGRVRSLGRIACDGNCIKGKILKEAYYSNKYKFFPLRKNGVNKTHLTHRLIAIHFIANPENKPQVNHINGIKTDNRIENLEWVTREENLKHALHVGLMKSQCKIRRQVIVKYNEKIVIFETMLEAAAYFGFKKGWLQNRIRRHGHIFNYNSYIIEVCGREVHKKSC